MTHANDLIRSVARDGEQHALAAEEVALDGTQKRAGAVDNLLTRLRADQQAPPPFGDVEDSRPPTEAEIVADDMANGQDLYDGGRLS